MRSSSRRKLVPSAGASMPTTSVTQPASSTGVTPANLLDGGCAGLIEWLRTNSHDIEAARAKPLNYCCRT